MDTTAPLPEDPALTAWLAERTEALSAWADNAFDGAWRWNFHPDTLDWLEAVVRQRFATAEEFDASRDEPFVQGACWYMGEVIRRNKGAVWQYIPFDPDAEPGAPGSRESAWTEVPFVDQPDRVGGTAIPLGCLRELLPEEEVDGKREERLRDVLFRFRSSSYAHVGALLQRMVMAPREKVDSVLAECADFAHQDLPPHEVPDALEAFGVAISAHADSVDDLEESYAGILLEYGDVLEFARNGVLVTQQTEHVSDRYLDHLAIDEFMGHVDPDPGDDTRRFHLVQFVHLRDANYENYYAFATPEQAIVLEKELGLDLR